MVSNAHASTTPHHVGQITKAEIEIAGLLEEWNSTRTDERAQTIVERMQALGWKAPPDPNADLPPLTGPAEVDGPGYRQFTEARAALAARRTAGRDT